ncbi:MAG TPA: hypothetical protein VMU62_04700, partial [Acidobacteriaceae bacterium]|nr:hypothetical protein [Acidobacteriaceae bacterium]
GSGMVGAIFMAVQAFRKNTAAAIPEMTGGEYLRFNNGKGLDGRIGMLANQVHNRYMLSFQPDNPRPGLHVLNVTLKQDIGARVLARTDYWAAAPEGEVPNPDDVAPNPAPPEAQPSSGTSPKLQP